MRKPLSYAVPHFDQEEPLRWRRAASPRAIARREYLGHGVTSQRIEANNNHIDKYIVKATISKQDLERIINDLTVKDFDPLKKTIFGNIGLQSNSYITEEQGKRISLYSNDFMRNGIQKIMDDGSGTDIDYDGVKQAECRTKIQY